MKRLWLRCVSLSNWSGPFNLTNRSWGQFWPRRDVTRHYFLIGWTCSFICAGVGNDPRNNIGVKIDPRTCLTLVFLGPVSKVKRCCLWHVLMIFYLILIINRTTFKRTVRINYFLWFKSIFLTKFMTKCIQYLSTGIIKMLSLQGFTLCVI